MSLKEFTSRCSAITLITATAFGIAQAAETPASRPVPGAATSIQSPAADNAISARVKNALSSNNIGGVGVQTELGVVALTGTVANDDVRQKAIYIASAVDGVRSVDISALSVRRGA